MRSSPRFTRGTSVIAALVFAALLGAVVLGMNALQSGSTNTTALSAAAAAATYDTDPCISKSGTKVQDQCTPGCQYIVSASGATADQVVTADQVEGSPISGCFTTNSNLGLDAGITYTNTDGTARVSYETVTNLAINCQTEGVIFFKNPSSGQPPDQICRPTSPQPQSGGEYANSTNGLPGTPLAGGSPPGETSPPATSLGQAPEDAFGSVSGTPSNCTANSDGDVMTCTNSTPGQASDIAGDESYGYQCSYNASNQTTTCTAGGSCVNQANNQLVDCPTGASPASTVTCNGTNCTPVAPPAAPPCTSNCGPANVAPPKTPTPATNNSIGSALTSLATGLARGLAQSLAPCGVNGLQSTSIGGNGTAVLTPVTTVNPLTGQLQTSYVQQAQQPTTLGATMPCGQQAPYGVGSNGVACTVPPAPPSCSSGQTPAPISASGNGCVTSYQCVNSSTFAGAQPTAQLSCSSQLADVGQSISLSYSCSNATDSTGSGFSTGDQLSGTASTTIQTPPSGTNTVTYGLTCINNQSSPPQNGSASCSIQVGQASIVLVANPQSVQSGGTSSIGWVTSGMQSCVISSPTDLNFTSNNQNNTSPNGVAQTDAITGNTQFDLTCQTLGGETKTASTEVTTGNGTSTATTEDVTANSSADGTYANHGDTVTINWSVSTSTPNAAVSLWLIDLQTEQTTALIAGGQPLSGSYQWQIPAVGSSCNSNSYAPCASDLVAGNSYGIEAALYTPANAYLGPSSSAPSGSAQPNYTDYGYTPQPFTIGQ